MVRRLLDPDPATGQRRFTDRAFRYTGYQSADLAYAVTGHSAQGATVHTGIALVTGTEDRQWLYPAMTRGTDANLAFVFTTPARPADPQPGTRPAPELDRYDRIRRERQGFPASQPASSPGGAKPREPIAVLADVLSRDGAELSATETRRRNLANADHLAVLHAIWTAETRAARHDRYRELVTAALPPGHRGELSHQARWLYRTLHAAELAGLDPAESSAPPSPPATWPDPATSPPSSTPASATRIDPLLPQPQGPWTSRVPQLPDPARQAYLTGIAALMDDRTRRLGQHTAQTAPAWAITALGPVPADPAARQRLGTQGRPYRGLPRDVRLRPPRRPDRPRTQPPGTGPASRLAPGIHRPRPDRPDPTSVPCPTGGCGCSATPTPPQTAWAPRHVGKELRLSRLGAFDAALGAIRADAEAQAARKTGDHDRAARHEHLAASYRAMRDHYQQQGQALAQAMADRQEWEHATARSRHLAIAADAELRRRHPDRKIESLRSARPGPVNDSERELMQQAREDEPIEAVTSIRELAAQHQAFRARIGENHRQTAQTKDSGWAGLGKTLLSPWEPRREAILQPPKPQIIPSSKILQLAGERDIEREAAD